MPIYSTPLSAFKMSTPRISDPEFEAKKAAARTAARARVRADPAKETKLAAIRAKVQLRIAKVQLRIAKEDAERLADFKGDWPSDD